MSDLIQACLDGHLDAVHDLLSKGADIEASSNGVSYYLISNMEGIYLEYGVGNYFITEEDG